MEHLESDGNLVSVARTGAAVKDWPGWLAAVFSLVDNGVSLCTFSRSGRRLLLTEHGAHAAQRFCCQNCKVARVLFFATDEVSADHFVTTSFYSRCSIVLHERCC